MTVYCERDTQKSGNICIKCNGTWTAGTPLPACGVANGVVAVPETGMIGAKPYALIPGETPDSVSMRFEIPRSILLDATVRDLASNEPIFVLRASDLLADYLVEMWARNAETQGCNAKTVQAAREVARSMRGWKDRRYPT